MSLLLLFLFLASPQDRPPEKCTLSGTVVNALTGEPLSKVRILAEGAGSESGALPATTSDAKGRFTLVDLPPGRYSLKGQRNGFLDGYYGARRAEGNGIPITVEAGQTINDLQLKLTPFGVIAGTIRDTDGEPLARMTVTVHRLGFENGRRRIVQAGGGYTDDLGQYRIPDLPPGRYYVYVEAQKAGDFGSMARTDPETEDHSPKGSPPAQVLVPTLYPGVQDTASARTVEVAAGARVTGIDIALTRSSTVSVKGRATAPPGMRISNVQLDYANADAGQLGFRLVTSINDKGDFEFRGVPPGSYVLTASAGAPVKTNSGTIELFPEEVKARLPVQVGTSPVSGLRLVMEAGMEIEGKVTVEGDPKADLSGRFISFDDGQSDPATALVNADNSFKWTLPPGHYTVGVAALADGDLIVRSIRAQGRSVLDEGLTIDRSGKLPMEIVLAHEGGQLEGVALDADEKPAAGATIVLAPVGKPPSRFDLFEQVESDQNGRFKIEGITPGDYRLFAWEDVEEGAWWDPEFRKKYESQATAVTIAAKAAAQAKVHLAKEP